jgi:hypothetical protein
LAPRTASVRSAALLFESNAEHIAVEPATFSYFVDDRAKTCDEKNL